MSEPKPRVVEHPLIRHKVACLRDKHTPRQRFRELLGEIAAFLTYEATIGLREDEVIVETPLEITTGRSVREDALVLVPILRAGLGMVEGILRLLPAARVGHVGLQRDEETLEPIRYYGKIPPGPERLTFLVVDPMLATGGSASAALAWLKENGARDIRFMCVVAAPEGAARLARDHSDVPVYAAVLDRQLNDKGYILPGLGDAGDRLYGTV